MFPTTNTNRYGDLLKEFYDGIKNNNLPVTRMDEIQRIFNELWERNQLLSGILYPGGVVQVQRLSTPDGSVTISPGNIQVGRSASFLITEENAQAGGGSIVFDEDGMRIPSSGDAITFEGGSGLYGIINMKGGALYITYFGVSSGNLITNGDFETGDFSNWTEVDSGSKVSVEPTDRSYAARFYSGAVWNTDYIQQGISSSDRIVVTARIKANGASQSNYVYVGFATDQASENLAIQSDEWRIYTVILEALASQTYVRIRPTTTLSDDVYIDDVTVRNINSHSNIHTDVDELILASSVITLENPILSGADPYLDMLDFYLKTGKPMVVGETITPSNPPTGFWKLYFKSGGLYYMDDAGVETGPLT